MDDAKASLDGLVRLAHAAGTAGFPAALTAAATGIFAANNCYVMTCPPAGPPTIHHAWMSDATQAANYADFYLAFGAALDPANVFARAAREVACYRLGDLPATPEAQAYYESYFINSGALDEIGFVRPGPAGTLCISIGRNTGRAPFSDDDITRLDRFSRIASVICARHLDIADLPAVPALDEPALILLMEQRIGISLPPQERRVAGEILRGRSNIAIALALSLSVDTIKTHRRNLYARLNISSQGELFRMVLRGG
jgi:DNA-binding CsgD family transcriptional regulator